MAPCDAPETDGNLYPRKEVGQWRELSERGHPLNRAIHGSDDGRDPTCSLDEGMMIGSL